MVREEEIRSLAYNIWQQEGCPDGRNVEHWLKAEAILKSKNGQPVSEENISEQAIVAPQRKRTTRRSRLTAAR